MSTKTLKKKELTQLIESVRTELFTDEQWEEANQFDSLMGTSDSSDMLSQVLETAFEREPHAFNNVQWINSEYGFPLWVRPGVEWQTDYDDDELDL
jgi:hypothetical protein